MAQYAVKKRKNVRAAQKRSSRTSAAIASFDPTSHSDAPPSAPTQHTPDSEEITNARNPRSNRNDTEQATKAKEKGGAGSKRPVVEPVRRSTRTRAPKKTTNRNFTPGDDLQSDDIEILSSAPIRDEDEQDKPEKRSREKFQTKFWAVLPQITEEFEVNDADRSIGGYEMDDSEWNEWKMDPAIPDDEYDEIPDSGNDSDIESVTTVATLTTKAHHTIKAKPVVPSTDASSSKKGPAGRQKRTQARNLKRKELDEDSDEGMLIFCK